MCLSDVDWCDVERLPNSSSGGSGKKEGQARYLHVFLICRSYNFHLAQTESNVQPVQIRKLQSEPPQYLHWPSPWFPSCQRISASFSRMFYLPPPHSTPPHPPSFSSSLIQSFELQSTLGIIYFCRDIEAWQAFDGEEVLARLSVLDTMPTSGQERLVLRFRLAGWNLNLTLALGFERLTLESNLIIFFCCLE